MLERQGRLEEAVSAYQAGLLRQPAHVEWLLGLERTLDRLGRIAELAPALHRALDAAPRDETIREAEFRLAGSLFGRDSLDVVAARWVSAMPDSPRAYRAWAFAWASVGDLSRARAVIATARERLGEWLLPQDAALFAVQAGDWRAGVGEWRAAVRINPQYLMAASASLGRAPEAEREELLRRLLEDAEEPTAQWLAADLLARWGRGDEGWVLLDQSLPEDRRQAVMLLRRFVATAGEVSGPEAARARGFALERLAGMATGAEADRLRLDAARAFADAGSPESAQRLLSGIRTTDSGRGGVETAGTLIGVLADAGQVARADSLYREWAERLPGSQRDAIEARLAAGWLAVGSLERAEQVLGDDSTVAGLALRGWIALFRGNLTDAAARFRAAGPTTGSRDDATRRAAALVTIERVSRERFPELGEAELAVYQGDTARGVALLERAANELPPVEGRADLLARAGMLAARSGATQAALRLLPAALAADSAGPAAPGAEFALASLYADLGRDALAAQHLEHLILTRSGSAVIPLARRLLDRVRGRIPRS